SDAATSSPVPPFNLIVLPIATTPAEQLHAAGLWVQGHPAWAEAERRPLAKGPATAKSKLAVGYLSSDFFTHATASLTAELFEKHDRQRFEIVAYSYGRDDGTPMRRR